MKLLSITPLIIEMTDAQMVLDEWHSTLTDNGMYPMEASNAILATVVSQGSTVERLMEAEPFRTYLDTKGFPKDRHINAMLEAGIEASPEVAAELLKRDA